MSRTKFYRGYVVTYERSSGDTFETGCRIYGPHSSWQAAEECARRHHAYLSGRIETREVPGEKRRVH